jgi:hypothetical protein
MYKSLLFFIAATLLLTSCKKLQTQQDSDEATCANIKNITITSNSPVNIGDPIKFSVPEVGGYRIYTWNGPDNFRDQYPEHTISYAELKHEGWYYVSVSNNSCETKIDSVYIDVKLQQGTPPCNVTANTATYSNLADDAFSYRYKGIESTFGLLSLEGSGNGNIYIYFHPEWRTREPEDGIYTTTNVPLFDQVDYNYNKVFITTTKSSIYWSSHQGQQVYISHVAGKLQVRFCNLDMSGYNGNSYTTTASGNITEH